MTLRRRLLAAILLAAVPLALAVAWARQRLVQRAAEDEMRDILVARLEEDGGRERCEQAPASLREPWTRPDERMTGRGGGAPGPSHRRHRHPIQLWAYDAAFTSADPEAPPFPPPLRRALGAEDDAASRRTAEGLQVAVRMPWEEGPCAVLLAVRPEPARADVLPGVGFTATVLCLGFAAAVWLAASPVVRRIHGLADAVRRSAAGRYAEPVPVRGGDEVAGLAVAFNQAGDDVRAQMQELTRREETLRAFLASTTHDVMLPLTVLQGYLSRLRHLLGGEGETARLSGLAMDEAAYLGSLVHNLSAAAKLEAGEPLLELHRVDLGDVVERVVARHRPPAEGRRVELGHAVPESPTWVQGDVTLVEQAVGNLVGNAVRHNHEGGHVAVVLETDARGFVLRVEDDGPGVTAADLARLGEPRFRSEEARQRHPEGRGLGLAIARDVAARHGFTLAFRLREPHGLVAELRGPLLDGDSPPA